MLREIGQSGEDKHCVIPLAWGAQGGGRFTVGKTVLVARSRVKEGIGSGRSV